MVLRAGEFDPRSDRVKGMRNEPLKSMHPTHYVVEVTITEVVKMPADPGRGKPTSERQVEEMTRVITKNEDLGEAIDKAIKILNIEAPDTMVVESQGVTVSETRSWLDEPAHKDK